MRVMIAVRKGFNRFEHAADPVAACFDAFVVQLHAAHHHLHRRNPWQGLLPGPVKPICTIMIERLFANQARLKFHTPLTPVMRKNPDRHGRNVQCMLSRMRTPDFEICERLQFWQACAITRAGPAFAKVFP